MALRQPTLLSSTRPTAGSPLQQDSKSPQSSPQARVDEQQEWILFPRPQSLHPIRSEASDRTPRTAGLSRLSDFGSLNSIERSGDGHDRHGVGTIETGDDDDLDSLDDGLNAFHRPLIQREHSYGEQRTPIFPTHDGLGTFPTSSPPIRDQTDQLEHADLRELSSLEHSRRASSVKRKLDEVEDDGEAALEHDKRERIEQWRLEHSRILLDEIEKETRRRQSIAQSQAKEKDHNLTKSASTSASSLVDGALHGKYDDDMTNENESFLQSLTRRIIHNVVGIDEDVLAVILGEALPDVESRHPPPITGSPDSSPALLPDHNLSWQSRMLKRLALEIGVLLDQLTEPTGSYAATTHAHPPTLDYAGIPITRPTSSKDQSTRHNTASTATHLSHLTSQSPPMSPSALAADSTHASLWGIEEEPSTSSTTQPDRDYWEQPPNFSNVLGVIRTHFGSPPSPSHITLSPSAATATTTRSSALATTLTPEVIRRAALIRQYHPIMMNNSASASAEFDCQRQKRRQQQLGLGNRYPAQSFAASSCGSQSLRLGGAGRGTVTTSTTTTNTTTSVTSYGNGSSRNYWDLGGGWGEI